LIIQAINDLSFENKREQALQEIKEKYAQGIPVVLFGKAQYGLMVEEYLRSFGIDVSGVFVDDQPGEENLTYDEIKKKYDAFIVLIGFIKPSLAREEKIKQLKCEQMKGCYYLDFPFPRDGTFLNEDYLEHHEEQYNQVYDYLSDELSREVYLHFLASKLYGDSSILKDYYDEQVYFPRDIMTISEQEIFVDCGAYNGDTLSDFLSISQGRFKKYYALEPDEHNFGKLIALIHGLESRIRKKITPLKLGAYIERSELNFSGDRQASSTISPDGDQLISVDKIDHLTPDATFIKMDVEGSELMALYGAEATIKRNKPKLAISAYHKYTDLLEIPIYIKSLVPEYRLYLRLHAYDHSSELVLYAVR